MPKIIHLKPKPLRERLQCFPNNVKSHERSAIRINLSDRDSTSEYTSCKYELNTGHIVKINNQLQETSSYDKWYSIMHTRREPSKQEATWWKLNGAIQAFETPKFLWLMEVVQQWWLLWHKLYVVWLSYAGLGKSDWNNGNLIIILVLNKVCEK